LVWSRRRGWQHRKDILARRQRRQATNHHLFAQRPVRLSTNHILLARRRAGRPTQHDRLLGWPGLTCWRATQHNLFADDCTVRRMLRMLLAIRANQHAGRQAGKFFWSLGGAHAEDVFLGRRGLGSVWPAVHRVQGRQIRCHRRLTSYTPIQSFFSLNQFLYTVNRSRHKIKYDTQLDKVASSEGQ
jgi:hypothetical protein